MPKKQIILINKPLGATPLEAIENFKRKNKEYRDEKMTYAGRLDPMATGLLIVLSGKKRLEREKFQNLNKEYIADILFGIHTDTGDVLGIPKLGNGKIQEREIRKSIVAQKGNFSSPLPAYSSQTVNGKPLFWWARNGKIDEIVVPTRATNIRTIKILRTSHLSHKNLIRIIERRIKKVNGDFRQKIILKKWRQASARNDPYFVIRVQISCTSGTYIRAIAIHLGKIHGSGALLINLLRTRVGKYKLKDIK